MLAPKMIKKWLKIRLFTKFILCSSFVFLFVFGIPVTLHAGVFSFVSELMGEEVSAAVPENTVNSQNMALLQAAFNPYVASSKANVDIVITSGGALVTETGVSGTLADIDDTKSSQISLYVVRAGDSLSEIAKMFGVSVNTIKWANAISNTIREGNTLVILPVSGVSYTVVKGDTLRSIVRKYKADLDEVITFNNLKGDEVLAVGTKLIIPDGEAPSVVVTKSTAKVLGGGGPLYEGYYLRPIIGGRKSQGLHGYNAVDIASAIGTPIVASAEGVVIVARSSGWNGGYGKYVVISHPNGTQTLYGHMNTVSVEQGQLIKQGETIGSLGNTGKSTGPHVHFEIRGAKNPF